MDTHPAHTIPDPSPKIIEAIAADLAPLTARRRRAMWILALLLPGLAVGLPALVKASARPGLNDLIFLGAWALLSLPPLAFALGARFHAAKALWAWLGGCLLLGLAALAGTIEGVGMEGVLHWACLAMGLINAAALLLIAVLFGRKVLRRHAPTGLLLGLSMGLLALIPTHLSCPIQSAGHLMIWHASIPVCSGALLGLIWGARRR